MTPMEPHGQGGRLADVNDTATHGSHDELLIAAFAAGDLTGPQRDRARGLIESCGSCRSIHADLVVLSRVTREAPPAVPPRSIDFRLSDEDARRLSRPWQWLAGWLAGPRGRVTQPVAAGLATLGVAAILLSSTPMSLPASGGAAAPAEIGRTTESTAPTQQLAPAQAPELAGEEDSTGAAASAAAAPSPAASTGSETEFRDATVGDENDALDAGLVADQPAPLLVVGLALVGIAVVVLALRPLARRLT
jgi:hypothetical protein